ncbi:MAG: hypothetical protein SOZ95_08185 [Bacilli bacterium]|nr:hypothetical protein [Bacilli bacterium]
MKYILKKDFYTFKHILVYSIIFYILPLFVFRGITHITNFEINTNLIENFLSFNIKLNNSNWILIIISFINTTIYFMLMYMIMINDIEFGKSNIFLRMDTNKWLSYKNVSLIVSIIFYSFIRFILISLLFGYSTFKHIDIIIYQCLLFILIANLLLLSYTLFKHKELIFLVLFILSFIIKISLKPLTIIIIFSEILILKILKLKRHNLLERR